MLAALAAATLAACGEADQQPQQPGAASRGSIVLTISYDDGAGAPSRGRLTCRAGEQRAEGSLAGRAPAARLCAQARKIAAVLTEPEPERRACTQIYGGPQTARLRGSVDGTPVDRRFTRTNGCEIADFDRVAGVLAVKPRSATRSP